MAAHVNVTTVPGAKIKQALVEYGGYLVDGTGDNSTASPGHPAGAMEAAICMDAVVNSELRGLLGYAPTYNSQEVSWHGPGKQLYDDLTAIFQALHAVVNNGPSSIGGGGHPKGAAKATVVRVIRAPLLVCAQNAYNHAAHEYVARQS